jgi:uncharacterized protein YcaQ
VGIPPAAGGVCRPRRSGFTDISACRFCTATGWWGAFDPKLERKTGLLRLKALHLEPGIAPDDELTADVAVAMRDFMKFHAAKDLVIEASNPPEFGDKLVKTL